MLTEAELRKEQQNEAKNNKLAEAVIHKTAWGKFYGIMRAAAKAGEDNLPHKVCVDKDGRLLRIYKGKAGKWIGTFLKPAHEQASRDASRHKYGRAVADMLGFGGFIDHNEMKKAKCFIIRPKDVLKGEDRKLIKRK